MDTITKDAINWLEKIKNNGDGNYDPLITYYFINKNLKMSSGKIGVQTARAGQVMFLNELNEKDSLLFKSLNELFEDSFMHGNKSICLRANENQLKRILLGDLNNRLKELSLNSGFPIRLYPVYDIGATEVATNSLTVVAMTPIYQSVISDFTRKFHVY